MNLILKKNSSLFENIRQQYIKDIAVKESLENQLTEKRESLEEVNEKISDYDKTLYLLRNASIESREVAINLLNNIVTTALCYITNSNKYKFKIEYDADKKNLGYEMYIITNVNGIESKQKPKDANGGGFVDIISTTLKFIYSRIITEPKLNNIMSLDEPGKMISKGNLSERFAEFLKKLAEEYKVQIIMCTHDNSAKDIATNLIQVYLKGDESKVITDYIDTDYFEEFEID